MFWLLPLSTPDPGEVNPNVVTPGVTGFIVTFALAVVVVLLMIDMVRRTRRLRYRVEANVRLDAEEARAAEKDA
ncbi:MAG: hypothetical protein ABIR17_10265 [Pseudolysinimonas sp.]|uniref:hypothetical protein n=1 Tax=Pseudolysinimonas sp. TaxID=2680009 RepID=UPI003263F1FC